MTLAFLRNLAAPAHTIRLAIALAALALTLVSQWPPQALGGMFANEWLRDRIARLQVGVTPEPRVLVIDIDETSLQQYGPWPWPHARMADLVENLLTRYNARGVALDIVLAKSDPDPQGTARLATLAQHGPLVLAQAFDFSANRPAELRQGQLGGASAALPPPSALATGFIANHPSLAGVAKQIGNIGFIPDPDGALRRVPMVTGFGGQRYPGLQLALVQCCGGAAAVPLVPGEALRVHFKRDWNAYAVLSAAEVLSGSLDPAPYRERLVVVGSSSLSLGDLVTTPLAENRPGLAVQATILSNLLDLQAGTAPARWPGRLLACLYALAAVLLATWAIPRLSAFASVALLGSLSTVWLALAFVMAPHDPNLGVTGPLASNLFLLAFAIPYQWQLTQGRSRQLLDTLRQYVAPEVVDQLLQSGLTDPLKPRSLDVTTLIADMEGYTTQVESLPVEEAASLTRDFLDCLTGPVIDKHGTLDKYTGDGLVAFWGAPLPIAYHADLALDAAQDIVKRVAALSARRVALGRPPLRVRIGIESGVAMAGDFGTSFRSIYTAVGDSVNTASRLEQAARDFPHCVIIGAGTVERAQRHRFLALGERHLRGKEKAVALYTLADASAKLESAA